jgi:acetolactate synthase regulatory subunit
MSHLLKVQMRKAEGSLVRLLGQIGRRGYDVLSVNAALTPDRAAWYVTVEFEPFMPAPPAPPQPRPAEVLPALVAKLVDVVKVELVSPGAAKAAPSAVAAPEPAPAKSEMKWEE